MQAPGFWDDSGVAAKVSSTHALTQKRLEQYRRLDTEIDDLEGLLELAAEDLVRLDGKTVEAATFREFVDALYARDEFPEPENHWAALEGNDKGSA